MVKDITVAQSAMFSVEKVVKALGAKIIDKKAAGGVGYVTITVESPA